jgi:tetratricopeptide (TPR) repeat protein
MSRTLGLAKQLLERGRRYQDLGRHHDALAILGRLEDLRDLPPEVVEETRDRLAEILLRQRQYRRARRHLTAALVQRPQSARYHFLLAQALNADPRGDSHRAAEHYRKSLELDPEQPACLGEFGLLALRLGQTEEGLTSLRRAAELAPNDPEVIQRLAAGLQESEQAEEARAVLLAALFRNSRDPRFRRLWNDFQFRQLCDEQAARSRGSEGEGKPGPTLLPFVRPAPDANPSPSHGKRVRHDGPTLLPPPHLPGPARLPDRKHA